MAAVDVLGDDEGDGIGTAVVAREGGRSSIPEAEVIEPKGRGVPDDAVKPGHDGGA